MSKILSYNIRKIREDDRGWIRSLLIKDWGSPLIVTRGVLYQADSLLGFIAEVSEIKQGLLTYHMSDNECEIITLNSYVERHGIGSALINAIRKEASTLGCKRLWLITTNDNVSAIRFYQKRGFALVAIHRNAVDQSRRLKPEIPFIGINGIPIRDEIEIELMLDK
jgi:GNAT superfamily N-acetyltransferase